MQGEKILIKSSALISLILVLFALTAFTCFGLPYSVALYDGDGTNAQTIKILADNLSKNQVSTMQITGKEVEDGGLFSSRIFDGIIIRGDKNITDKLLDSLYLAVMEGLDVVILGKVDLEKIAYPDGAKIDDFDEKAGLSLPFSVTTMFTILIMSQRCKSIKTRSCWTVTFP
jgi:hypothetical protein